MESDYNSKKYEYGLTKPFAIVIRQTFLKIHVTSFTDTFTGVSYGESFYVIKDKGVRRLTYLYSNDPDNPNTKLDRQGVCELKAVNDPATQLAGKFWTINGSNGNISVNKSTGEHLESYNSIMKK